MAGKKSAKKELPAPSRLEGLKRSVIFRMILDQELTLIELKSAFAIAFKGAPYDPEDENHIQFDLHCKAEIARLKKEADAAAVAEAEKLLEENRERARVHLRSLAIDPEPLPKDVLDEIWQAIDVKAAGGEDPPEPVYYVEDLDAFVTAEGSIVHYMNIEHDDRIKLFTWIGEKMSEANARKEGLLVEKALRIKDIETAYASRIRREDRIVASLKYIYKPMAEAFLKEELPKHEKSGKSMYIGLLCLGTRIVGGGLDIMNAFKAALWVKEHAPAALSFKPEISKTGISLALRKELPDVSECGMAYTPKTDEFYMTTGKGAIAPADPRSVETEEESVAA